MLILGTPVADVHLVVGAAGIVEAFNGGADVSPSSSKFFSPSLPLMCSVSLQIILTGRVTDASPIIAASIWWHGWKMDNYDALAGALLAGHCIVCCLFLQQMSFWS